MNARTICIALSLVGGIVGNAHALDSGPKVIGCDFKFGASQGTDKCLILGSGIGQGESWNVFEVKKKRFRHFSSAPNKLTLLDSANNEVKAYTIQNTRGQCRPGGPEADIYQFNNGDRICLYW